MYEIKVDLIPNLPQDPFHNGVGAYEGVCLHETACGGYDSDESETAYFKNNWQVRQAFVHAFADDDSITQNASWDYKSWGCGNGNGKFLNIELCNTENFIEAYNRWIWLAALKLFEKKLGVIDGVTLVSHAWVSKNLGGTNHEDPIAYLGKNGKTWENVINDVTYLYNQMENQEAKQMTDEIKETEELPVSEWAAEAQAFVIHENISDGTRPHDNVTREEIFVMLKRLFDAGKLGR